MAKIAILEGYGYAQGVKGKRQRRRALKRSKKAASAARRFKKAVRICKRAIKRNSRLKYQSCMKKHLKHKRRHR